MVDVEFGELRRKLDQCGYLQPLGLESVPLVRHILADLLHTTASLKDAKAQLLQKESISKVEEQRIEPFKSDNSKLIKEVNALHLELIRRKDIAEAHQKTSQAQFRNLEHENADLKFLNTEYAQKSRTLEIELERMRERIDRLNELNMKAVIQTQQGDKQAIPTRRQRMEIKTFVNPPRSTQPRSKVGVEESTYTCDLLKVAEAQISTLTAQVASYEADRRTVDARFATLQAQIQRREEEIDRLGRMLEAANPSQSLFPEPQQMTGDQRHIAQLETQVDYLQQVNNSLQEELVLSTAHSEEMGIKFAELEARNKRIMAELDGINRLSHEAQKETRDEHIELGRQLRREKAQLDRKLRQVEQQQKSAAALLDENAFLVGQTSHLTALLSKAESHMMQLTLDLEQAKEEKRYLTLELEQVSHQKEMLRFAPKDELERLKETLSRMEKRIETSQSSAPKVVQNADCGIQTTPVQFHDPSLKERCMTAEDQVAQLRRRLEESAKTYSQQIQALKDHISDLKSEANAARPTSDTATATTATTTASSSNAVQDVDIAGLRRALTDIDAERDKLQSDLDDMNEKFDQLTSLHATSEQRIAQQLRQIEELRASLQDAKQGEETNARDAQALRRQCTLFQAERDAARNQFVELQQANARLNDDLTLTAQQSQDLHADVLAAVSERDDLLSKMQQYTERIKQFEELLRHKEAEKEELLHAYRDLSSQNSSLESKASEAVTESNTTLSQLRAMQARIMHLENERSALKASSDVAQSAVHAVQSQNSALAMKLAAASDAIRAEQARCAELESNLNAAQQFAAATSSAHYRHNDELHGLQARVLSLERDLTQRDQQITTLKQELLETTNRLNRMEQLLASERARFAHLEHDNARLRSERHEAGSQLSELRSDVALRVSSVPLRSSPSSAASHTPTPSPKPPTPQASDRNEATRRFMSATTPSPSKSDPVTKTSSESSPMSIVSEPMVASTPLRPKDRK